VDYLAKDFIKRAKDVKMLQGTPSVDYSLTKKKKESFFK